MTIKTASCKAKGRALQYWVRDTIIRVFELEPGDVESRPMGSSGSDLMTSPAARKKFPISVECKNTKKVPAMGELKQSEYNAYPDTIPVLVWKPSRVKYEDSLVVMKFKDFAEWYRKHNVQQD